MPGRPSVLVVNAPGRIIISSCLPTADLPPCTLSCSRLFNLVQYLCNKGGQAKVRAPPRSVYSVASCNAVFDATFCSSLSCKMRKFVYNVHPLARTGLPARSSIYLARRRSPQSLHACLCSAPPSVHIFITLVSCLPRGLVVRYYGTSFASTLPIHPPSLPLGPYIRIPSLGRTLHPTTPILWCITHDNEF